MLQRFYVNNFKCLENFELKMGTLSSALLIGKNGSGKSAIAKALVILQQIGRGSNRVGDLIAPSDMGFGKLTTPVRLELEVLLDGQLFNYELAFELEPDGRQLRVREERLSVAQQIVYERQLAQAQADMPLQFSLDWHLVGLPVIAQQPSVQRLRVWLAQMIILAPIPERMRGSAQGEGTLLPERDAANFGDWLAGLLKLSPRAYLSIGNYLQQVMPDFSQIKNTALGQQATNVIEFCGRNGKLEIMFDDLSDGEKCFFLCAVVLAANEYYGPVFCFWDEPGNYLALSEIGHFIAQLRQSVAQRGQFLMTSHNEEAIRKFSDDTTLVLDRKSHLEPTMMRPLAELGIEGDLINALIRGDVEL